MAKSIFVDGDSASDLKGSDVNSESKAKSESGNKTSNFLRDLSYLLRGKKLGKVGTPVAGVLAVLLLLGGMAVATRLIQTPKETIPGKAAGQCSTTQVDPYYD